MRQAFAGMLWGKQYYGYNVARWLDGDPGLPPPPAERKTARNAHWRHFDAADILSMPDPWEYPWFAAWDLASTRSPSPTSTRPSPSTSCSCCAASGSSTRTGRCRPTSGRSTTSTRRSTPPPRCSSGRSTGEATSTFLKRIFHKLLLNFTWWLNREDKEGNDLFSGGFLGPRQHRCLRPLACPRRGRARAVGCDRLDVRLLPRRCSASRRSWPGATRTKTS